MLNGTDRGGLAATVSQKLANAGYSGVTTGDARNKYGQTTVYFKAGRETEAREVASGGGFSATFAEGDSVAAEHGVDIVVVLGSDY